MQRVPKTEGLYNKGKKRDFQKQLVSKLIRCYYTQFVNTFYLYKISGILHIIEFINFFELRKNFYLVSEVLTHAWKGGDKRKGV